MEGRPNTSNKAPFWSRMSMEGGPKRRNKAPFS